MELLKIHYKIHHKKLKIQKEYILNFNAAQEIIYPTYLSSPPAWGINIEGSQRRTLDTLRFKGLSN